MKICIVSTIFPPEVGGPSTHIYELSKQLVKLGHEVHIVTYTHKESRSEIIENFHVHRSHIPATSKYISIFQRVNRLKKLVIEVVRKYNIDIIYALNIDLAGLPAVRAARKTNKPVILRYGGDYIWEIMFKFNKTSHTLHDFYNQESGIIFHTLKSFQSRMLRKFKHIIVPSFYYKDILEKNFKINPANITVIKNPVELQSNIKKTKQDKFTIVAASRILRLKGLDYLLYAIKDVINKHQNIQLLIIGEGPYKKNLEELVKKLNLENYVKFLGNLPHKETLQYIKNADCYILSSISEVAPNVVFEAMSLKTAVITTLVSDFNQAMNENIALIVQPKDSKQLADAILKLIENPKLKSKLALNGYKYVKSNSTWQDVTNQTLNILEKNLTSSQHHKPA